jgi:hypothetical protein
MKHLLGNQETHEIDIRPSVGSICSNGKDYLKGLSPYYPHMKEGMDPNSTLTTKSGGFTNSFSHEQGLHILSLLLARELCIEKFNS